MGWTNNVISSSKNTETVRGVVTCRCTCDEGWGADTDVTLYRAADCSARVCPSGKAWGDVPFGPNAAHQEHECSSRWGIINKIR